MLRDGFLRFCDDPEIACCRAESELGRLREENASLHSQLQEAQCMVKETEAQAAAIRARFTIPVVCMCGSSRFKQTWLSEGARLSKEGNIVLYMVLWDYHNRQDPNSETKAKYDELHKRKIDLCDWVWVLDVGGYIGDSTRSEIEYAKQLGKPIRYLSQEFLGYQEPVDQLIVERDKLQQEVERLEAQTQELAKAKAEVHAAVEDMRSLDVRCRLCKHISGKPCIKTTAETKVVDPMEFKFNVTGARRKELVQAISEILNTAPEYKGPPTFAYVIGGFTVNKAGTLCFDENNAAEVDELLKELDQRGFQFEAPDKLVIEMPKEGFTEAVIANLERLVKSKGTLIKKALGADQLPIEQTEDKLRFPWFSSSLAAEEVNAYARFIGALCAMAKNQHRVTATEKAYDNEKYAFRCFLLRLGFIGPEYKEERKVLLSRLTGSAAFKNGQRIPEEVPEA